MRWFGESWGAPVNESGHAATPVGAICPHCLTEILDGDRGLILPVWPVEGPVWGAMAYHHACFMAEVLGPDIVSPST